MYSDTYLNVFGLSPGYSLTLESPPAYIHFVRAIRRLEVPYHCLKWPRSACYLGYCFYIPTFAFILLFVIGLYMSLFLMRNVILIFYMPQSYHPAAQDLSSTEAKQG